MTQSRRSSEPEQSFKPVLSILEADISRRAPAPPRNSSMPAIPRGHSRDSFEMAALEGKRSPQGSLGGITNRSFLRWSDCCWGRPTSHAGVWSVCHVSHQRRTGRSPAAIDRASRRPTAGHRRRTRAATASYPRGKRHDPRGKQCRIARLVAVGPVHERAIARVCLGVVRNGDAAEARRLPVDEVGAQHSRLDQKRADAERCQLLRKALHPSLDSKLRCRVLRDFKSDRRFPDTFSCVCAGPPAPLRCGNNTPGS